MKRLLAAAAALLLCLNILPTAHGMGTSAGSAILMEAESGRVLYEQNAHEERLIASITKLMTALVALESGHPLEEKVVIREEDTRTEGSSLYLRPGEELRLETLLYGLLLQSGNDAALAVARHCGGTVENFVAQMNLRAARLGMEHSRFANPSGLNAEGHCSTARDLALLARACLKNETLAAIAATRSVTLEGRSFVNHNKLLWRYEGCVGLKTGYTEKAGRTLVSAAEREGMTLIAVTLDDPDDWRDHAALFDWGFSNWKMETAVRVGEEVRTRITDDLLWLPYVLAEYLEVTGDWSVCGEKTCYLESPPLREGERLELRPDLPLEQLTAPVQEGVRIGTLRGAVGDEAAGEVPLVCGASVPRDLAEPRRGLLRRLLSWLEER